MDSMGFPRGLIRYDAQPNIDAGGTRPARVQWKRLKTLGYGIVLSVMCGLLVYVLASRSHFEESVQQVRQPLFVVLSDGQIRNRYQVRITNKTDHEQVYDIKVRGIPENALDMGDAGEVRVRPGKSLMVPVNVKLPTAEARSHAEFDFIISPRGKPDEASTRRVRFYSREEN
jgi:polyferredoxin